MVVIEVFTPVVQRILKHNMVSCPDSGCIGPFSASLSLIERDLGEGDGALGSA